LLTAKKEQVEKLAKELLDKEVLHKSDVEALIGNRPFEEEKVVTFDVEEGKDKITTEETLLADAASTEQPIVANSEQDSVASTEQTNAEDNTDKPSAA